MKSSSKSINWIRFFVLVIFILITVYIILSVWAANYLTSRLKKASCGNISIVNTEKVSLTSEDGIHISASYIQGTTDKAVIILSGIKGDRTSNVQRALYYKEKDIMFFYQI